MLGLKIKDQKISSMPNNSLPTISIILLNYNGRTILETSIPSILKQSYQDFEVILVDNGSTDKSLAFVQDKYPQIKKILRSPYNSFSVANNLGIKNAVGKYIFILNNDVELDANCLEELMHRVKNSDDCVGMWATKILNFYHRNIIDNTGLLIYPDGLSRGRGRLEENKEQYDKIEEICFPSGCAGLYKKEMLDEVGYFDEDFRFYVEDSDLGFRGRLAGWKCLYAPKAIVYHMYSVTHGKYTPIKAFHVERNRLWFALKLYPWPLLMLNFYFSFIRYCYQLYGVMTKKGAAGKFTENFSFLRMITVFAHAWFDGLIKAPKIIKKRKIIKQFKKVSNKEIYSWFKKFKISAKELSLKE